MHGKLNSSRILHQQGFTLIELLVAIFIMSLLAVMSWRGIDGMARAQEISRERADHVATLQTALAQWQTDLDQMLQMPQTNAMEYNGRVVRMTRRYGPTELRVVAWAQRDVDGQSLWLRWQSAPVGTRAELDSAWQQAAQWGQNPREADRRNEVSIANIDSWQLFYYRNDAWTNPQSAANALATPAAATPTTPASGAGPKPNAASNPNAATSAIDMPDGVRLVLTLSAGQALAGTLTRDWVRPNIGGGKS
jgi:general secretion pathway protein J